jgi:ubiquinone/menaquinone biosynthesis C-methylase UbiE
MIERTYGNVQEFHRAQLISIVDAARTTYQKNSQDPIRILDLATGPNEFNPLFLQELKSEGIPYEMVLSDISPSHIRRGYANLERTLDSDDLNAIKVVLVDSNNLRKKHTRIPLFNDGTDNTIEPLEKVLQNPEFYFLQSGYNGTTCLEEFKTGTFDLVIGQIPYGSMQVYDKAIEESARILRIGGYHIVQEWQVEEINKQIERTPGAMRGAQRRHIDEVQSKLDQLMEPVAIFSNVHPYQADYYEPDELVQNGDILKDVVLIHQKTHQVQSPFQKLRQIFN